MNTSDTGALWIPFQTAAGTVTTLYKGKDAPKNSVSFPIQPTMGCTIFIDFFLSFSFFLRIFITITESCDSIRRVGDIAINTGYQRRAREIAEWARNKRRRYIRREDLLAYLAGKSSPPHHGHHGTIHVTRVPPQHLYSNTTQQTKPLHSSMSPGHQPQPHTEHHHLHNAPTFVPSIDSDLHTFKDALARRSRFVTTTTTNNFFDDFDRT